MSITQTRWLSKTTCIRIRCYRYTYFRSYLLSCQNQNDTELVFKPPLGLFTTTTTRWKPTMGWEIQLNHKLHGWEESFWTSPCSGCIFCFVLLLVVVVLMTNLWGGSLQVCNLRQSERKASRWKRLKYLTITPEVDNAELNVFEVRSHKRHFAHISARIIPKCSRSSTSSSDHSGHSCNCSCRKLSLKDALAQ